MPEDSGEHVEEAPARDEESPPSPENVDLMVVGGGFAGVSLAAGFKTCALGSLPTSSPHPFSPTSAESQKIPSFLVLESGDSVAGFWRSQVFGVGRIW